MVGVMIWDFKGEELAIHVEIQKQMFGKKKKKKSLQDQAETEGYQEEF